MDKVEISEQIMVVITEHLRQFPYLSVTRFAPGKLELFDNEPEMPRRYIVEVKEA